MTDQARTKTHHHSSIKSGFVRTSYCRVYIDSTPRLSGGENRRLLYHCCCVVSPPPACKGRACTPRWWGGSRWTGTAPATPPRCWRTSSPTGHSSSGRGTPFLGRTRQKKIKAARLC
ncbi:unnamed protein product [Laminaria digitata]